MGIQDKRNTAVDNLRAFFIICVVAGHLLEILSFTWSRRIYVLLYSFHMPAFVFVSGMCSKLDINTPRKLLHNYVYPYFIFQTLYLLFDNYILHNRTEYQYTTPYWLLWYLVAMILWQIMLWMYSGIKCKKFAVSISILVALLAGFDSSIGYYASMSRALVMFPYFLMGYYAKEHCFFDGRMWNSQKKLCRKVRISAMLIGGILFAAIVIYAPYINNKMLYHAFAYSASEFHIGHRIVMMGIACIWIGVLFALIPRKKIPWITYCGKNTLPVFVLHGFVVKILNKELVNLQINSHWILFIALTILIPVILTLPPVIFVTKPFTKLPDHRTK